MEWLSIGQRIRVSNPVSPEQAPDTRSPKALGAQHVNQERHRPPPGVPAVLVPKTSRSKLREGLKAGRKTFPGLLSGSRKTKLPYLYLVNNRLSL